MNQKIYTIQIQMTSQSDCNRMKEICEDYNLPYWKHDCAFNFTDDKDTFTNSEGEFFIHAQPYEEGFEPITIEQFLELLNEK